MTGYCYQEKHDKIEILKTLSKYTGRVIKWAKNLHANNNMYPNIFKIFYIKQNS